MKLFGLVHPLLVVVAILSIVYPTTSFVVITKTITSSTVPLASHDSISIDDGESSGVASAITRRRDFCQRFAILAATTMVMGTTSNANAAMKSDQKVFEVGKDLTIDQARARFKEGQVSLDNLLENYDAICEGGGDNVRRYLGTVGTTSGLYGISKVLKILSNDEHVDIVDYNETMEEFNAALTSAEGSAYMAIFTESSTSGVPPSKYFKDTRTEAELARVKLRELAKQLDIR